MALTQISTGGVKNDAVTAGKIPANAIGSSEIADDAVDQGAIADEAVDEARLQISNAGTNGQFLQKQSGNTGGLTWAAANEYTHPNHSGEVTSTADGAQVIASDVVDEDNLKISNAGTNGQFLQKQSGNTGGLTWADVTIPPAGNTVDLVADGAIAAGKPVIIKSNGKAEQVKESLSIATSPTHDTGPTGIGGTGTSYHKFSQGRDSVAYDPESDTNLVVWANSNDNALRYKLVETTGGGWNEVDTGTIQSPATHTDFAVCSLSNRRFVVVYEVSSNTKIKIGVVASDGQSISFGSEYATDGASGNYYEPHAVAIGDNRVAILLQAQGNSPRWTVGQPGLIIGDVTSDNVWNYRNGASIDNNACDGQWRDIDYDSTNDVIGAVWRRNISGDTNGYFTGIRVASGTGAALTIGTPTQTQVGGHSLTRVAYNAPAGVWVTSWKYHTNNKYYMKAGTVNSTTLASTWGSNGYWNHDIGGSNCLVTSTEGGAFGIVIDSSAYVRTLSASFSGTSITLNSGTSAMVSGSVTNCNHLSSAYNAHTGRIFTAFLENQGASNATMHFSTNKTTSATPNFTSQHKNFLGFAEDAISDGNTGTIKLEGNVVGNQSGLTAGTQYHVEDDGSLDANWDNTDVGLLAISSTSGIIRRGVT